jgi:hypothetical protein
MLARIIHWFAPPPIRTGGELGAFLGAEAAYLTQRVSFEFSRNTLSYFGQHMWAHDGFLEAMRVCRWRSFPVVLADMLVYSEGKLRSAGAPREAVAAALGRVGDAALDVYPAPPQVPEGWTPAKADIRARLARGILAAGADPIEICRTGAKRMFDTLPIRSQSKTVDRDIIDTAVRFVFVGFAEKFAKRVRAAEVVADIVRR